MSCRWLHPAVWVAAVVVLGWGLAGQWLVWMPFLEHRGRSLSETLDEGLATSSEERDAAQSAKSAAGTLRASHLRAPSHVLMVFAVYHMPLFLLGVAGWVTRHWRISNSLAWRRNARVRAVFNRSVPHFGPLQKEHDTLTYAEALVGVLVIVPKVVYLAWFVIESREVWEAGTLDVVGIPQNYNEGQFWVERVALWTGTDFLTTAPFLFAFVARGSLVNSYFGVSYGTIVKWHRWIGGGAVLDVIVHGLAYQAVWISDSLHAWSHRMFRFEYRGGVSSLSAFLSWIACIALFVTVHPSVRRRAYWVFYWSHIIASAVFVVFGIVHTHKVWKFFAPGLVLYGIDVAYRWLQASHDVTIYVTPGISVCSVVIPVQEGVEYGEGGHVWLRIPQLGGKLGRQYHPFCVASTPMDSAWRSCMLLHCKAYSRWTRKLLDDSKSGKLPPCMHARVQGPFDSAAASDIELRSSQRLLVASGGIGLATVLPMLKRMALMREEEESQAVFKTGAKVTIYHTARTLDELALIAPLLEHPDLFTFHLHLTQDPIKALQQAHQDPAYLSQMTHKGGSQQQLASVSGTAAYADTAHLMSMSLPLPVSSFQLKHAASWASMKREDDESAVTAAQPTRCDSAPIAYANIACLLESGNACNNPLATSPPPAGRPVAAPGQDDLARTADTDVTSEVEGDTPTYTPPEPPSPVHFKDGAAQLPRSRSRLADGSMHAPCPLTVVTEHSIADPFATHATDALNSTAAPVRLRGSCDTTDDDVTKTDFGSSSASFRSENGVKRVPVRPPLASWALDSIARQTSGANPHEGGLVGGSFSLGGSTEDTIQFYAPPPKSPQGAIDATASAAVMQAAADSDSKAQDAKESPRSDQSGEVSSTHSQTQSTIEDLIPKSESRHMWQRDCNLQDNNSKRDGTESPTGGSSVETMQLRQPGCVSQGGDIKAGGTNSSAVGAAVAKDSVQDEPLPSEILASLDECCKNVSGEDGTKQDPEKPGEGWLADDEAAPSCASGMGKFDCASGSEEPPDDAKALRGPTHKWESLLVWVVAWGGSFWLLALGDIYMDYRFSGRVVPELSDAEYERRMQHRAGFHILACALTLLIFPLLAIYAFRGVTGLLQAATHNPSEATSQCSSSSVTSANESTVQRHIFVPYYSQPGATAHRTGGRGSHACAAASRSISLRREDADESPPDVPEENLKAEVSVQICVKGASPASKRFECSAADTCIPLREVVLDVLHGNIIQMRLADSSALPMVVSVGRPDLAAAVRTAYDDSVASPAAHLSPAEVHAPHVTEPVAKISKDGPRSDETCQVNTVTCGDIAPFNIWAAGPQKMNAAVCSAARALPLTAHVGVFPMAYEL